MEFIPNAPQGYRKNFEQRKYTICFSHKGVFDQLLSLFFLHPTNAKIVPVGGRIT